MENKVKVVDKTEQLMAITHSEIDMAIATAKKFPRDIEKAVKQVQTMACIDKDTAEDCFFALPRGGKTIEGESIRFAEIVAQAWGNIKYATRVLGHDGRTITAQAVVYDLENNIMVSKESEGKITDRQGVTFNEDLIILTGKATASKALRDAILQIVPKGLFSQTIKEIKEVSLGKATEFQKAKENDLKFFRALNVTDEEICKTLSIKKIDEIDREKLLILRGIKTAIKDNDTDVDQAFGRVKSNSYSSAPAEKEEINNEPEIRIDIDGLTNQILALNSNEDLELLSESYPEILENSVLKEVFNQRKKEIKKAAELLKKEQIIAESKNESTKVEIPAKITKSQIQMCGKRIDAAKTIDTLNEIKFEFPNWQESELLVSKMDTKIFQLSKINEGDSETKTEPEPETIPTEKEFEIMIMNCKTIEELKEVWEKLPQGYGVHGSDCAYAKELRKGQLLAASKDPKVKGIKPKETVKKDPLLDKNSIPMLKKKIKACDTLPELQEIWEVIPDELYDALQSTYDFIKSELS